MDGEKFLYVCLFHSFFLIYPSIYNITYIDINRHGVVVRLCCTIYRRRRRLCRPYRPLYKHLKCMSIIYTYIVFYIHLDVYLIGVMCKKKGIYPSIITIRIFCVIHCIVLHNKDIVIYTYENYILFGVFI